MQSGGQLPSVKYIPVAQSVSKGGGASTTSTKEDDSLQKEIFDSMEYGLNTDFKVFSIYAEKLLNTPFGGDFAPSVSSLIKIKNIANQIKNSKQLYDRALARVESENTGEDFALTTGGKVYVLKASEENEGALSIDTISIEDLKKSDSEYVPITNNQLLEIRNNGSIYGRPIVDNVAFNEKMLRDVTSSIGMDDVMADVDTILKRYGNVKYDHHEMRMGKDVEEGLEGLYKITIEKTNTIVSPEATKAAAHFIYNNLNDNAKNVLKVNAVMSGSNVLDYLVYTITSSATNTQSVDLKKSKHALEKEVLEKDSLKTSQPWANMVMEDNGRPETYKTIVNKSTLAFNFPGFIYDGIETKDKKSLHSVTSAAETFMNLANQGLTDSTKQVYFGNIAIDIGSVGSEILIDNTRGGSVRYLPVDDSGNLSFSMMQQMANIQNEIIRKRITDKKQIRKIWEDNGFLYSEEMNAGIPKGMRLARFWVQDGYTNEATSSFNDPVFGASRVSGNQFFQQVSNDVVNRYISSYNSVHDKNAKLNWDIGTVKGWYTDSYRGSIFIPINDDQKQALVFTGNAYIAKPDYDAIKARQDQDRIRQQWVTDARALDN